MSKLKQQGFTLVELLIVVIILAILAAIVVPQFAASTKDASDAALRSNLAAVRSAVDLYRQQHNGDYPGAKTAVGGGACAGTAGAGTAVDAASRAAAFQEQLTLYTDRTGKSCSSPSPDGSGNPQFPYGPYLRSQDLPVNPLTDPGSAALSAVNVGDLNMTGDVSGVGWKFDVLTGRFIANTDTTDANGVRYDTY
ncbi:MAG: type II secretion system protein [Gammaproteobacteria bacterium]|nr:type II secretion system protein [Gammaproteobacteria bacterium]